MVATVFWGFGFVGARWALDMFGPFWMSGIRFTLAFLITLPVMLWMKRRQNNLDWNYFLKISFWPGLYLTLTIVFQTWGLNFTTATNAGFITTLYVVIVPIIEMVIKRQRPDMIHMALVLMAVLGTALICQWQAAVINKGDFLTLLCAFAGAAHIVCISHYTRKIPNSFYFNNFQCLWAGVLALGLAVFTEKFQVGATHLPALTGFGLLLFGSTLFGFWAQIRAQKVLSANAASLICLLESPFAALFAFIFLAERLNFTQWIGALLILVSAAVTIILEQRKART